MKHELANVTAAMALCLLPIGCSKDIASRADTKHSRTARTGGKSGGSTSDAEPGSGHVGRKNSVQDQVHRLPW